MHGMRSLVLGLALLACCTSTAGLSSGGSPTENTHPTEEEAPTDARSPPIADAEPPTVAPPADAGDAGACGDAAFCDDFDGVPNGKLWTLSGANDAAHGVDALAWLSSPRSLWAETVPLGPGDRAYSYRYARLATGATRLLLTFDLLVEKRGIITPPPSGELVVAGVGLEDEKGGYLAELLIGDEKDTIKETRTTTVETTATHNLSMRVPIGKWIKVTIDVLRFGQVWGLSAKLGDAIVLSGHQLLLWTTTPAAKRVVNVGIVSATGPSTPWRVRIDDVVLR
jgi:hypothetical protein